MIQTMVRAKYDSDPVKAWKESQKKIMVCTYTSAAFGRVDEIRLLCAVF